MFTRDNAVLIKQEPTALPSGRGFFKSIVTLTWLNEDMTTTLTLGCTQCGHQDTKQPKMAYHIGVIHNGKTGVMGRKSGSSNKVTANSMDKIQRIVSDLETERDMWKAKARKYERQLKALQQALVID
jgi:hypothetical protein